MFSFVRSLVCNVDVHTMVSEIAVLHQTMTDIKCIRFRAKGILLKPNLAMWLATLVMFVGSTAHYTVVWLWMVHDKSVTQYFVDTSWDLFYANTMVSWPHGGPSLSAILQYLPIVNVSPSCQVTAGVDFKLT